MNTPTMTISATLADEIFRAVQHAYRREDVEQKLAELFPNRTFDKETVDAVLTRFERVLDHSDGYCEEYWLCLEEAIRESGIKT